MSYLPFKTLLSQQGNARREYSFASTPVGQGLTDKVKFDTPQAVVQRIRENFDNKPQSCGKLTLADHQMWGKSVMECNNWVIKHCELTKAIRGISVDNFKTAATGMTNSVQCREYLTVLNDRTRDMINVAYLAKVELFHGRVTQSMYNTFGKYFCCFSPTV